MSSSKDLIHWGEEVHFIPSVTVIIQLLNSSKIQNLLPEEQVAW